MSYAELKEIIKHLKKIVPCNTCQKRFGSDELQVVSTFQNEGLFHLSCGNCHNQLLVHVAIMNRKHAGLNQNVGLKLNNNLNIQTHKSGDISPNEVLDIHNFLKQFNGDFKNLFTS